MMLRHHPEKMKIVFPEWPCSATVFMMLRYHPENMKIIFSEQD
jgi:hypothetical protein